MASSLIIFHLALASPRNPLSSLPPMVWDEGKHPSRVLSYSWLLCLLSRYPFSFVGTPYSSVLRGFRIAHSFSLPVFPSNFPHLTFSLLHGSLRAREYSFLIKFHSFLATTFFKGFLNRTLIARETGWLRQCCRLARLSSAICFFDSSLSFRTELALN